MKTLKQILLFYLIIGTTYFLTFKFFPSYENSSLVTRRVFILPLIIITLSLVISLIYNYFSDSTNKLKNQRIVLGVVASIFLLINLYFSVSNWKYKKDYGNIDNNENYFKSDSIKYYRQRKALNELSKQFDDKNSFAIEWFSDDTKDTLVDNLLDTIFYTKFEYIKTNSKLRYRALISNFRNTIKLLYYDRPLTDFEKKQKDSMDKTIRNVEKVISDSLGEELNLIDK